MLTQSLFIKGGLTDPMSYPERPLVTTWNTPFTKVTDILLNQILGSMGYFPFYGLRDLVHTIIYSVVRHT